MRNNLNKINEKNMENDERFKRLFHDMARLRRTIRSKSAV